MSLAVASWGGLLVTEANGATEFVGLHILAVLVLVIVILLLYPSISKLINAAPSPASDAAQKYAQGPKAVGRTAKAGFAPFNTNNNVFLGNQRSDRFLGVPEPPNYYGNAAVSQGLLDVTLDSIKAEGASGLGALGDLAKADMVAAADAGNMAALEAAAVAAENAAKASGGSVAAAKASLAGSQKFATKLTALGL